MRKYETIFVIDSLLKSDEIESIITKYEKFISANGGQIETLERWGKKRLAFEIKKRQYGYYVFIRFDGSPSMIKPLEREYRLNESILRYKTILLSTMALKALAIQQAMGLTKRAQEESEDKTAAVQVAPVDVAPVDVAPVDVDDDSEITKSSQQENDSLQAEQPVEEKQDD